MAFAEDYIEVPSRIAEWYSRHPEGRIVCEVVELTDVRVTVKAAVYRSADPTEPPAGVGHSYLGIPGTTPFTRGAELENAETSAAGRALVMAGIPSKNVASAGEVRSKKPAGAGSQRHPLSSPAPAVPPGEVGTRPAQTPATASPGNGPVERPASPVPVPQPESGETTAGMGADAGSAGGGDRLGKAATTPCPHTEVTGFKPDDTPLPTGFLRCLSCGKTFKDKAA